MQIPGAAGTPPNLSSKSSLAMDPKLGASQVGIRQGSGDRALKTALISRLGMPKAYSREAALWYHIRISGAAALTRLEAPTKDSIPGINPNMPVAGTSPLRALMIIFLGGRVAETSSQN